MSGKNPRSIYVIYTGGTLGMKYGEDGSLAPEPEYLTNQIRTLPDFSSPQMPEITINEWNPIWDSSDISHDQWERLAQEIESVYYDYDGFVILHGTDTMSYTASALSFMLENLGKPVIITGSSIPFCDVYNDARRNLVVTFMYASLSDLCEVCIFFNNHLLRGNRSTKYSIRDLAAFTSLNFPPLGVLGVHMTLKKARLLPPPKKRFRIFTKFNRNIIYIRLVPGCSDDMIRHALAAPCQGVILEVYGAGNAPSKKSLYDALTEASQRGVVIVILSQCKVGWVDFNEYKAGSVMRDAGAVSGMDMTPEAAATKLAYLLGKGLPVDQVKAMMEASLRGELTPEEERDTLQTSLEYLK